MIDTDDLPRSQNEGWGFYGTMKAYATAAWPLAMLAIRQATEESLEDVRAFMDSRHGRYFGDSVLNAMHQGLPLQDAIDSAVREWMGFRITKRSAALYGMPAGMPYLLAWVIQEGIHADLESR